MMKSILGIKCSVKCCSQALRPPISSPKKVTGVLKRKAELCSNLSLHLNQKKTDKMGLLRKCTLNKPKRKPGAGLYYSTGITVTGLFVLPQVREGAVPWGQRGILVCGKGLCE